MKRIHSPHEIWRRIRSQGPLNIARRIWVPLERRLTGAPVWRYCQITPQLYLGGQHGKRGLAAMQSRGIHSVVNLREEFDDAARGLSLNRYLYLPTTDGEAPTLEHIRAGVAFIHHQTLERGDAVYVHCWVGVGRAATVVAAYLVAHEGETPQSALARIETVRPFVWPSQSQRERLQEFAATLPAP
ncbi:MAG: dual specificity protein phosphatase family protein [Chloroflexi bacterium]|nr:dual specificity protein phosphatase family protein [Chloroflexota bacterium]